MASRPSTTSRTGCFTSASRSANDVVGPLTRSPASGWGTGSATARISSLAASARVAIARAVVAEPPLLLADEPTGNLDSASGATIVELLHELNGQGTTIVVITHDNDLAAEFPRRISIRDGRIVGDARKEAVR
jgi:ABC-type phosphate/phosphonate transport system ATPase subunit